MSQPPLTPPPSDDKPIRYPLIGWNQGLKCTNGNNVFVISDVIWRGYERIRFVLVNPDTQSRYEYSDKQLESAILDRKIWLMY